MKFNSFSRKALAAAIAATVCGSASAAVTDRVYFSAAPLVLVWGTDASGNPAVVSDFVLVNTASGTPGTDLTAADDRTRRAVRGRAIGYVPQDPVTNLNPVWKVGVQIREALRANNIRARKVARARSVQLLTDVGMPDPAGALTRYPHQLSGGMCQRALIAIGLTGHPRLLIADEPTSALDVTVQRQVLDHLAAMAADLGTAVLFITHDLALAAERAGRIVVMRDGRIMEVGAAEQIIADPQDEYTRRLVACAPALSASERRPPPAETAGDLIVATDLTKVFPLSGPLPWRRHELTAVDAVSFRLRRGSTLAVAGDSAPLAVALLEAVITALPA